jgi:perosamine synthetase
MIPVFSPDVGAAEIEAVVAALKRGELSGTFGEALLEFEQTFAKYSGCKHGIAVSSGTTALHLAVAAAKIGPGDEVLVSASTNIASALAIFHNGALTVPVDSENDTWNLDLDLIEGLITPRTRAILPVHLFGHPVDMDRVMDIARRHRLLVIEDAAEAHGAKVRGRPIGGFGDMSCFSFYANKIITTGEGGMVTTNDDALAERLRLLRNLAFTKPRFWHEEAGYNFRMTGFQAALGLAQLRRIDGILEGKRAMAKAYTERLQSIVGLQLPIEQPWAYNVYWMYGVVVKDEFGLSRDNLMKRLAADGIETRTFFCPMDQQPFLRKQAGQRLVSCPVAGDIWQRGLYLPSSHTLTSAEIQQVCDRIAEARARG